MIHAIFDLLVLVALGMAIGYWLYSWWSVSQVVYDARQAHEADGFLPPVSVLKPLKGADATLAEDLRTFCKQNYPSYEIICGVSEADDPAVRVVRKLQREFPGRSIRLMIVQQGVGANPKSAILARLTRAAEHDLLVISDSDIRVTPDYLRRVVHPLADPRVGLVTCAYRSESDDSVAGAMSALYVDATLLPAIAVARHVPGVRFAFGATMAMRRADLMRGGGYEAIADHLADDYRVGALLADQGLRTRLSDYIVAHTASESSLVSIWNRELRWQRTIRAVEPLRYMGLPLTFGIPWAIVLLAISGGAIGAWAMLGVVLVVRGASSFAIAGCIDASGVRRRLFWLPVRDCLTAIVWVAALSGHHVRWRGKLYRLLPDGRLEPAAPRGSLGRLARGLVRRLDRWLRDRQGIFEFTEDPECLFRASLAPANRKIELRDGTTIARGQRILELHFWNERLSPPGSGEAVDLPWAVRCRRELARSFGLVAEFLESRPDLADIRAIGGISPLGAQDQAQLARIIRRFGFELHSVPPRTGFFGRLREIGENMLSRMLIWTFNPSAHRMPLRSGSRTALWISRRALMEQYARRQQAADEPAQRAPARKRQGAAALDRTGRRRPGRTPRPWESVPEPRRLAPGRVLSSEADA